VVANEPHNTSTIIDDQYVAEGWVYRSNLDSVSEGETTTTIPLTGGSIGLQVSRGREAEWCVTLVGERLHGGRLEVWRTDGVVEVVRRKEFARISATGGGI
jgi:hypothetical protein